MLDKKQTSANITYALEYLKGGGSALVEGGVSNSLIGKVSSFGPSVVSMGFLPTLMLYSRERNNKDRLDVQDAILAILRRDSRYTDSIGRNLAVYAASLQKDPQRLYQFKQDVLSACVALKLAVRTYPEKPEKKEEAP